MKDLRTTVDYTNVSYSMPEAVLTVGENRFPRRRRAGIRPRGNRGKFNLDLNFEHLSNITFDVRVAPQQMLVLNTTEEDNDLFYGRVHATGGARITGRKGVVEMEIAASTDSNSDFYLPLSGKSNISDADFVIFEKPVRTDSLDAVARRKLPCERRHRQHQTAASRMSIGLALDVRPNANVELTLAGNTLKAKGSGTLNLQINPKANIFEIYGDYTLSEGSFLLSLQNIISKRFTIENGSSIQWTGAPDGRPARHRRRLQAQGFAAAPAAGHDRQPRRQPLGARGVRHPPRRPALEPGHRLRRPRPGLRPRNADGHRQCALNARDGRYAICLPAVVQQLHGRSSSLASSNIGSSVSAATGMDFLSNMVSGWFSSLGYDFKIGYRPRSEQTSDEVDFGISKSLVNDRLLVEVEGNYLIDNKQAINSSMSNFMGEAYITYLIDPAGTLKLKAFTQTIDRFDENQGLQETGIGIYFKEDFDNLRDLKERIKARSRTRPGRHDARRGVKRGARHAPKSGCRPSVRKRRNRGTRRDESARRHGFVSWVPDLRTEAAYAPGSGQTDDRRRTDGRGTPAPTDERAASARRTAADGKTTENDNSIK